MTRTPPTSGERGPSGGGCQAVCGPVLGVDLTGDVAVATVDAGDEVEGRAGDGGTEDRGQPEQPQLTDRAVSVEERHAGGAGGVDRGVRDRDGDEVDEGEHQADGDRREALRCPCVGRTEDDVEEHRGEQHLGDEHREQVVVTGGVLAVAVRRHVAGRLEPGTPPRDDEQGQPGEQAAGHLGDDVGRHVLPLEALRDRDTDGDGRVEVGARDVSDGVRHRDHGEAERQGHAEEADAELDGAPGDG